MAKKAFTAAVTKAEKKNPAQQIIDQMQTGEVDLPTGTEIKSKRVSFLVRPSVYADAKLAAWLNEESLNGIVNNAFEDYVEAHRETLEQYRKRNS